MTWARQWFCSVVSLAGAALLVACGVLQPGSPPQVEESVRARAQQRWDALLAGDVEKAYGFLSPGARQTRSFASYSAMIRKGFWAKAVVEGVVCPSTSVCKVTVVVDYNFRGSLVSSPVSEDWVFADGQWWAAAG